MWAAHLTLERTQWLSGPEIEAGQLEQLRALVAHASEHVPYYREVLDGIGITADAIRTRDDVLTIPILSRSASPPQLTRQRATVLPEGKEQPGPWPALLALRQLDWYGFDVRGVMAVIQEIDASGRLAKQLLTGVSLPDWGARFGAIETGPSHLMDARTDPRQQLDWLLRIRPQYLVTSPANLAVLARAASQRGQRIESLRAIHAVGDPITAEARAAAVEAFGVPVRGTYSSVEVGDIASTCPDGEGWHVHDESVLLEVLDAGRVVVTGLHDFAAPLLRHEVGALAERSASPCPCGRGLMSLSRIVTPEREHGRDP